MQACCLLYIWAKSTVAFTCTSLPLSLYTSVFGCGCGFGFEQKVWRIDGFGGKKRHGSADLHTPIHPPPHPWKIKNHAVRDRIHLRICLRNRNLRKRQSKLREIAILAGKAYLKITLLVKTPFHENREIARSGVMTIRNRLLSNFFISLRGFDRTTYPNHPWTRPSSVPEV